MRDNYVAAAVQAAWAAECHARAGQDAQARENAAQAKSFVDTALGFCSDAPAIGPNTPDSCDTLRLVPCGR